MSALENPPWHDDLLGRKEEAELLAAYIKSVAQRNLPREDSHAYTIAIDADYGVGKTFFLRRLREHLSATHPVAFVDAWADDLSDEPMTALAATLKAALEPIIKKGKAKDAWKRMTQASGEVAKIVGMGLAKQTLSGLVSTSGADLLMKMLAKMSKEEATQIAQGWGEIAAQAGEEGTRSILSTSPDEFMDHKIRQFERGKEAVREFKGGLRTLVDQLPIKELDAPIVIIIDELDRCRPTYAIKVLEEIKHLFDVRGLVFVLGMNRRQLAQAVRGAYGLRFDGDAYLRRFVNRTYSLRSPHPTALVEHLLRGDAVPPRKLDYPKIVGVPHGQNMPRAALIAEYIDVYGATARDVYQVVDKLQTCVALTGDVPLLLPYLLPLIISEIRTGRTEPLASAIRVDTTFFEYHREGEFRQVGMQEFAKQLDQQAKASATDLARRRNRGSLDLAAEKVFWAREYARTQSVELADPSNYRELLAAVGRFDSASRAG